MTHQVAVGGHGLWLLQLSLAAPDAEGSLGAERKSTHRLQEHTQEFQKDLSREVAHWNGDEMALAECLASWLASTLLVNKLSEAFGTCYWYPCHSILKDG